MHVNSAATHAKRVTLALALATSLTVGCGRAQISGDWVSATPPVELRLGPGNTFHLTVGHDDGSGTWRSLAAEGVTLLELSTTSANSIPLLGGRRVAFQYILRGDTLTLPDGFNREGTVQLTRKKGQ